MTDVSPEDYKKAQGIVAMAGQASVSLIQRRLKVGYTKAAKIIEQLEAEGHIGPYDGKRPREVHIKPEDVKLSPSPKTKRTAAKKDATPKKAVRQPRKKKAPDSEAAKPKKSRKGIGGRITAWEANDMSSKLDAVKGWTMQGATMEELAEMLGIGTTTLYKWQKERPEFAKALRAGRHVSNGELLNAAFRASTGFLATKTVAVKIKTYKTFEVTDPKTGQTGTEIKQVEEVVMVPQDEYIQPNANLLQFMLTNRLPQDYQRKESIHHTGSISRFDDLSDAELEAQLRKYEAGGG